MPKAKSKPTSIPRRDHVRLTPPRVIDWAALDNKPALTIPEFCARWDITTATFANWQRKLIGPKVTRIGGRAYVTRKNESKWQRACEAAGPPARLDGCGQRFIAAFPRSGHRGRP